MQPGPTHGMPRASLHKTGRHSIADASSSTFTALPAPHRMALLSVLRALPQGQAFNIQLHCGNSRGGPGRQLTFAR